MQEWIRNLHIGFPGFRAPGRANLVIVLNDILISTIESDRERRARATGCAFEARVGGDHVIGQDSAITPAADAQSLGIGDAQSDCMINSCFQIFDFVMTPVRKNRA